MVFGIHCRSTQRKKLAERRIPEGESTPLIAGMGSRPSISLICSSIARTKFLRELPHFTMDQWVGSLVDLRRDEMIVEASEGGQQNANVDSRLFRFPYVCHLHARSVASIRQL